MPTLSITKNYDDGTALTESQLDDIKNSIETFVNTTKLDADNIQDLAITTAKIAAASVTQAKRAALGQQVSSSCGAYTSTATSATDITNLTITITTTGRPVHISLISDGSGNEGWVGGESASSPNCKYILLRDSTELSRQTFLANGTVTAVVGPLSQISHIDVVTAGTYTYKLQGLSATSATTQSIKYAKLVAFEL